MSQYSCSSSLLPTVLKNNELFIQLVSVWRERDHQTLYNATDSNCVEPNRFYLTFLDVTERSQPKGMMYVGHTGIMFRIPSVSTSYRRGCISMSPVFSAEAECHVLCR